MSNPFDPSTYTVNIDPSHIVSPNPVIAPVEQEVLEQTRQAAATNPDLVGPVFDGVGHVIEGLDVVGSAAEVAGEVGGEFLGSALETLGSGFEVAGGCAEGCSVMIAIVIVLATAGVAMAGWF